MIVIWAVGLFIASSAAILIHSASRYRQILRTTNYFIKAATVYVLIGEEDALLALYAAGKGASEKDRARMLEFLKNIEEQLSGEEGQWSRQKERIKELREQLASPGGHGEVAARAHAYLKKKNSPYVKALRTGDTAVFLRQFPQLFGTDVQAATADSKGTDKESEENVG